MAKKIEILENTLLKLLVRRGSNADREDVILSEGELGYTTDTNRLFVGDGVTPGGKIVGNKFLGKSNSVTTFANANVGDLAYDADDRALYAYAGPDPATSISGWTLISSVTDENTSNIKISIGNLDEGVNNIAGDGVVINNGRLAIDCAGINTNKIAPCANVSGALELPNRVQYGDSAAYTYSIPARTGSAGKFLVGDNNGNLSWSSDINVGSVTYFSTAEETVPVGAIVAFADLDAVQSNWLICNGDEYEKTTYPDLFNVIGYDYGGSDLLFQVPDLRDKVLYGTDDKPTNVGDIELGSGDGGGGSAFGTEWSQVTRGYGGVNSNRTFQSQPTTYTNDTGYHLAIKLSTYSGPNDYSQVYCVFGDVDYSTNLWNNNHVDVIHGSNSGGGVHAAGSIIVPPGEKYTFFSVQEGIGGIQNFTVFELRGPAGGSVSGISNASDIINIYGGGGGTSGAYGTTNSIPEGTYLVDVNWIENDASGTDEDTALTVAQKFVIPTGNYLHFASSGIDGFYAITNSATAPAQSSSDWVNINVLTGFKGGSLANDVIAIINGFAIKLDTTTSTGTGTADATPTVYAIKAVTDPVVSSTLTVKSPLTASVDGVLQGENPFNSLEGDIEIGIGQSTISLDDIKMFNLRSKVGVSKGYIESNSSVNDIQAAYRGSLPVSFDSDVKFVKLEYTSSLANPNAGGMGSFAEDSTNGTKIKN